MKNLLLTYNDIKTVNVGDYIQSLAAKQFFRGENCELINRDELNYYEGEPARIIINAWLTYKPQNWPPSDKIRPLFVALHINSSAESALTSANNIEYFKKHSPIGCRDFHTTEVLQKKGVDAYFSGCLTTTLGGVYATEGIRKGIYIVDPLAYMPKGKSLFQIVKTLIQTVIYIVPVFRIIRNYKRNNNFEINASKIGIGRILLATKSYLMLRNIVDKDVLREASFITQYNTVDEYKTDVDRFIRADELLKKYASAQYVITSRIHCALPCLGFDTPVVYIRNVGEQEKSTCRFGGLESLFNVVKICGSNIVSSFYKGKLGMKSHFVNKGDYQIYRDELIRKCEIFVDKDE